MLAQVGGRQPMSPRTAVQNLDRRRCVALCIVEFAEQPVETGVLQAGSTPWNPEQELLHESHRVAGQLFLFCAGQLSRLIAPAGADKVQRSLVTANEIVHTFGRPGAAYRRAERVAV